jgi:hypothetical protein
MNTILGVKLGSESITASGPITDVMRNWREFHSEKLYLIYFGRLHQGV